jgi:RNase H-fold protein (predicted Holliday junction resolvase)
MPAGDAVSAAPGPPIVVFAIDPGRVKCGLAVVMRDDDTPPAPKDGARPFAMPGLHIRHREIVGTERVVARVLSLLPAHPVEAVLVGDATGGTSLARALRDALQVAGRPSLPVLLVNEAFTSQRARARFFAENQPRGLQRLLPRGLRTPPVPVDDYAAVLLAEDFFANTHPAAG